MDNRAVVCLGELLVHFLPRSSGTVLAEAETFERSAGGAAANVAAAVARLGGKVRLIGKVGDDPFGRFLHTVLADCGVEPALLFSDEAPTGLAFEALRKDGERDFLFYGNPPADRLLRKEEILDDWLRDAAVVHFGSQLLIADPARSATVDAARRARVSGAAVSYDPNIRLSLWPSADYARRTILDQLPYADIVKVSDEEIAFLYGDVEPEEGARLMLGYGPRCIVITSGKSGCRMFTRQGERDVPGFPAPAVDPAGAGDAFVGGLLWRLADARSQVPSLLQLLEEPQFAEEACRFGNAVGSLAVRRPGTIPSLPTLNEVKALLQGGV